MFLAGLLLGCGFWASALSEAAAATQVGKSSYEPPDVYEFGPPFVYETYYQHDPSAPKIILNPDYFCTKCISEGRVSYESRDELAEGLEKTLSYPFETRGSKIHHYGNYRLMEREAAVILETLFTQLRTKNPVFIEDENFRLFTDLKGFSTRETAYPRRDIELQQLADIFPELSERTVKLNSHHRAHLYLIRARRVLREFSQIAHHDPSADYMNVVGPYLGCRQKFEIYIFQRHDLVGKFMNLTLGRVPSLDSQNWHNLKDDSMAAFMHTEGLSDVHLNNTFTHRLTHNFLQGFRGYYYDQPAWFLMGLAHLMERRERTDVNTFFFGEGSKANLSWGSGKWKPAVRKMVAKDDVRPLVEFAAATHASDVTAREHGVIWSIVSYQMSLGVEKFGDFIHVMKEKKPGESLYNLQVRAFQRVYGMNMIQFFAHWKEWVLETYPKT